MGDLSLPEEALPARFQLDRPLGQGSFGHTFLAHDAETATPCVVKQLSFARLQNWKALELFEREAQVLAQLQHPGIPRFLGYFPAEQGACLVQDYIPGQNLAAWVEGGKRFREPEIVALAEQVLDILVYLQGFSPPVIHRDIKPENLILSEHGRATLVDFGAVNAQMAAGSTVVGTFGYMPPEQLDGRAVPASDLFALGTTLIYALTGLAPSLMEKDQLRLDFRPHVQISEGLAQWLETMTQPDWKQRFQTASDALAALHKRHEAPGLAASQKRTPAHRRVLGLGLLGGLGMALALALAVGNFRGNPPFSSAPISGRLTYANHQPLPPMTPRFWLRNESTGQRLKPTVKYASGAFEIHGLPPGKYGLNVAYDANPANPLQYPGDYRAWTVFELQPGQAPPQLGMELVQLIHLTAPADNNLPLSDWEQPCQIQAKQPASVTFAWDSLGPGVRYDYAVQAWACSGETPGPVVSRGSTPDPRLSLDLPPLAAGHYYRFSLEAWQAGHKIGRLRTHGSQDHDWDFRFLR